MSAVASHQSMKNLESKIKARLTEQGMTIQRLATESGISEPTIHAIFNRGDAKLSQLEKIAEALNVPLSFLLSNDTQHSVTQTGDFNQAGNNNTQKVKANKAPIQDSTATSFQELAAALAACQRELEVTRALVEAKEESLRLLRAVHNRPN